MKTTYRVSWVDSVGYSSAFQSILFISQYLLPIYLLKIQYQHKTDTGTVYSSCFISLVVVKLLESCGAIQNDTERLGCCLLPYTALYSTALNLDVRKGAIQVKMRRLNSITIQNPPICNPPLQWDKLFLKIRL